MSKIPVIDLYLDECTGDKDKENLKVMYEKLAKDLNLDTKKQESALVQFVSDPEECANKIKNLLNKLPKQDKSDLNIEERVK
jgi:galactitol-specific phosphotransferase system IIB component